MIYGKEIDAELLCELLLVLDDLCELRPDSYELLVENKTNFAEIEKITFAISVALTDLAAIESEYQNKVRII